MTGGSSSNFGGSIYLEKFVAIPVGSQTNFLTLRITNNGTGNFTQISSTNGAGHSTGFVNSVYVSKYVLSPGSNVTEVNINTFAAAGNIRIKAYDGDGAAGAPSTQLYDGASVPAVLSGHYIFTSPIQVRTSGILWVGFELTPATPADIYFCSGACNSALTDLDIHTFGSGPNPFVPTVTTDHPFQSVNYTISKAYLRLKAYQDDGAGGGPHTLLGESGPQLIGNRTPSNPKENFTISATAPASGNLWVGFESSVTGINFGPTFTYESGNFVCCVTNFTSHTYGSGPNPITTTRTFDNPAMHLWYTVTPPSVTFKWDGAVLSTTPALVTTNTTGGFSGAVFTVPSTTFGSHTVNASDTGGKFATAPFSVPYAIPTFTITGYVLGPNGVFPYPTLKVISSADVNMTQLALYNATNQLYKTSFSPPFHVFANTTMIIPGNFTDASGRTGTQTYTEEAIITQGVFSQTVSSNAVTLDYGSTTIGKLGFNYTNPVQVPIWFVRSDSGSNTRLSVIFPNSANLTCNLAYQTAQTNHTYYNIPKVTYDSTQKNSSFLFMNSTNDFVKVNCKDLNNLSNTGQYVLTISNFPFIQQIQNFRSGMYGTTGQFGMLDIITLSVVIFSMIGFNRINEAVGAFFSLSIIGVCAYFAIISWPAVVIGAIAVVTVLAVTSVRKIGGF